MFRSSFQEEHVAKDSKLQAVFSKLSGVLPRAEDLGNTTTKIMSSDIIESVFADTPVPVPTSWSSGTDAAYIWATLDDSDCVTTSSALTLRLEEELRAAKRTHLACGEVLLPCGLLQRIARDIIWMAESEPCGIRGCKLFMLFEAVDQCMRIGCIQCDPATACTFELYLTLKQSSTGWNFLPQFIRNLTRGGTVVISPAYTLNKKKLYRSHQEQITEHT